ncbi:MAG: STAS domain-containing protein [Paracoccaceae bacterium]|nr:MAG: STAS domain-containing protein [Paracoccaceae bacterium]
MQLATETAGETLIVTALGDRIDAAGAIQFKERMREVVQGPAPRVVLDLSSVTFLDSSGLGAVVAVMKLLGPARRLELAGLTPTVEKVFRLTRMDSIFAIHATVPRALRDAG